MPTGADYGALILPPPRRREPPRAPQRRAPAPRVYAPSRPPAVFKAPLSSKPFAPAVKAGRKRVEAAQRALPQQPVPHIPRLPEPTPRQAHAALMVAAHSMKRALGPNPGTARIRRYQQELQNDPRLREFRETVAHYVRAAEGHLAAQVGRRQASGALTLAQAPSAAQSPLSRNAAVALGRQTLASTRSLATAKPGKAPSGLATLPLIGAAQNYLGERVAEDVPKLAAVGSAGLKLLTQPTPTGHSILANAVADVSNIGRVPLVGAYQFGGAAVGAAQGNLKPAKKLASGIAQGVEKGAVGQLVQGNLPGVVRALREHPVLSPLEVAGAEAVAGRVAGAAARTAGVGGVEGALGRAVGRARSPIALGQDIGHIKRGHIEQRTGSPDLFRGLAQQALDRQRGYVRDAKGRPIYRAEYGRKVAVVKPREGRIFNERERLENRRGNFYSAGTASAARQVRERVPHELAKALPKLKGRLARSLVLPASTATIRTARTFEQDIIKRIKLIEHKLRDPEANYRHEADQAAAEANLKTYRQALTDPKVLAQKKQIVKAGEAVAKLGNAGDAVLERLGVYPAARLERGRLSEYALAHVPGAKHGTMIEPEALALHEASVAAHGEAKAAVAKAETALRKAEDRRTSQVALHRSARMRGEQPGARPATTAERSALGRHDENVRVAKQQLKDAREHEQEAGQQLLPKPKEMSAIRDEQGNYLSNEAIRAHARASGRHPDTIAYMPHRLDERISRSYYKSLNENRPIGSSLERTGHLYEGGSTAISLDAISEELTNKATTAVAVKAFDRLAGDAGLRHPYYQELLGRVKAGDDTLTRGERKVVANGGLMKWSEGHELAERLQREGKGDFLPMRAHAARLDREATAGVRRGQGTAQMESAHSRLFNDRFIDDGSAANNVVLMPKTLIDRIKAQTTPAREFERWGRLLNVAFRYTVLPQFKWLAGNFIEPYFIRLPLSGSGVNLPGLALDLRAARKVIKHMEGSPDQALKDAAGNIRAQQLDPGLFIGGRAGTVHTSRTDFEGAMGRMMSEAAKLGGKEIKGFPVLHQLGQLAVALPKFFFYFNRHVIENPAQRAAFGKSVRRDMQKWTGQWASTALLGQRAVEEASRGLLNTATQHRFLKEQHELLGQYDTFGPSTRRLIQTYTPFLPWTLASLRFVYWTLPIHHTVAFNALMKAGQSVLPEWEAAHAGAPPGDLRWSPQSRGGFVDAPRLTPFGVSVPLSEEGPSVVTETFAPQVKGAQEALRGNDPFGNKLQLPSGEPPTGKQKTEIAGYSLLEGLVPYLATARRLQEGGGTSAATSTVWNPQAKPGTSHISPLERTLSPFRPIFTKAPAAGPTGNLPPQVAGAIKAAEQRAKQRSGNLPPQVQAAVRRAEAAAKGR